MSSIKVGGVIVKGETKKGWVLWKKDTMWDLIWEQDR